MRLCIATGLSGFLGTHILSLADRYPNLMFISLDRGSATVFPQELESILLDRIDISQADEALEGSIRSAMSGFSDVSFLHLASVSRQNESRPDGLRLIYDFNVAESIRLASMCISCGVSHILSIGSSWQFASSIGGEKFFNQYAISKECFELGLARLVSESNIAATIIYLYDNFGASDKRNKIVDLVHKALLMNSQLDMSPGKQFIDISPVQYQASLILKAITMSEDLTVSIGTPSRIVRYVISGHRIMLEDLVKVLSELTDRPSPIRFGGRPYRKNEIMDPIYPYPRLLSTNISLPSLASSLKAYIMTHAIES